MVVPKKFIEWRDNAYFPYGSKIRGLAIYKNFVGSCNGSFKHLPKRLFYSWVRDNINDIRDGKDARGIWFMIGDEKISDTITPSSFIHYTCVEFSEWFSKNYDSFLFSKLSSAGLRQQFLDDMCDGRESIVVNGKNVHLTKQQFNKWLEHGAKRFDLQILSGRDGLGRWVIIT